MFRRGALLPNAPAANVNKLRRMLPAGPKSQQEHSRGRWQQA
jgi:hypothetical protein